MTKINIIMPIYNMEKYIETSFKSLLNQKLKEWRLICINDGSTDSTLSILEKYAERDSRFVIINQSNIGYSKTINVGIQKALEYDSEYIGFLDPDDYISVNYFQILYNTAKKHKADIVATSNVKLVDENYKILSQKKVSDKNGILESAEDKAPIFVHSGIVWNKIYNSKFIQQNDIKFIPNNSAYCDNSMTIKSTILANKIVVVNKPIYYYVQWQKSLTKNLMPDDLYIIEYYAHLKDNIDNYKLNNNDKDIYKKAINLRMFNEFKLRYERITSKEDRLNFIIKAEKVCPTVCFKEKLEQYNDSIENNIVYVNPKKQNKKNSFLENIFSVKNERKENRKYKVITILGIKFKIKISKSSKTFVALERE